MALISVNDVSVVCAHYDDIVHMIEAITGASATFQFAHMHMLPWDALPIQPPYASMCVASDDAGTNQGIGGYQVCT